VTPSRRRLLTVAAAATVVLLLSWLFASGIGLVTSAVAMVIVVIAGPRWVAAGAFGAFVVAAVATVAVSTSTKLEATMHFTADRPLASMAAKVAGVLALVAVVGFSEREGDRRVRARDPEV